MWSPFPFYFALCFFLTILPTLPLSLSFSFFLKLFSLSAILVIVRDFFRRPIFAFLAFFPSCPPRRSLLLPRALSPLSRRDRSLCITTVLNQTPPDISSRTISRVFFPVLVYASSDVIKPFLSMFLRCSVFLFSYGPPYPLRAVKIFSPIDLIRQNASFREVWLFSSRGPKPGYPS